MIHWNCVRYFGAHEFEDPLYPGSGELIDGTLLLLLDKMRHETEWPIVPHGAVGGCVDVEGKHGHADDSMHLKRNGCKAVDFHFLTYEPLEVQFNFVCRYGFPGIGVYPEWRPGAGFHIDMRPIDRTQHWIFRNGVYNYFL